MSSSQRSQFSLRGARDKNLLISGRTPVPTHRHAAPSGPWPWMDFDADDSTATLSTSEEVESSWRNYPQNKFKNWTPEQVKRSKMLTNCSVGTCKVFRVDVLDDGRFDDDRTREVTSVAPDEVDELWDKIIVPRPSNVRARAVFVDNMNEEVLKILGTKYVIEPFFFSSSMNWIPSRYQEAVETGKGDHITIILPFIRPIHNHGSRWSGIFPPTSMLPFDADQQDIDTQAPLLLHSSKCTLIQDLLAIHMIRGTKTSTLISYHPNMRTSAQRLHSLIQRTGRSVYWSKIFEKSKDPTFLFLTFLWYALYAWDESLELLYKHITWLEAQVLHTSDIHLTRELHILQAHLLHYKLLLEDFRKSVQFVLDTTNPAMRATDVKEHERELSAKLLRIEVRNLLDEIKRLDGQRKLQSDRLQNVMDLAFASVNIDDSRYMKRLSEATLRDSAAMKQIAYLTMVFFPASFMAGVFGMNVREFVGQPGVDYPATLPRYAAVTLSLTCIVSWVLIALQAHSSFHPPGCSRLRKWGWPVFYVWERFLRPKKGVKFA
ncbi:hypothetical protein V8B97DRAFT_701047 [Scleroderma yunnanense]